jgi:FixJ family two-component response regulator
MKSHVPTVYVVDDDDAVREALGALLESVGLSHQSFASSEEFLAVADRTYAGVPAARRAHARDERPGAAAHAAGSRGGVAGHHHHRPWRCPDGGARDEIRRSDFIEKPFNEQYLLDRIHASLKQDHALWHSRQAQDDALSRFGALTPREKMVMDLIAAGNHTKKIAAQLDIQDRTVDVHRFNIMRKVGVRTLAELLHLWTVAHQPVQG